MSCLLIALLLSLWAGGVAKHYCLDGLEPPVTVHFENFKGHVDHETESGHNDFESLALADNLLKKSFDIDDVPLVQSQPGLIVPDRMTEQPLPALVSSSYLPPLTLPPPPRGPPAQA
jgi:hypothetical protein